MKTLLLAIPACLMLFSVSAQNVGIGITNPTEKLQVDNGNAKIGDAVWTAGNDRVLRFGDGDYVHIGEVGGDDQMEIKARLGITLNAPSVKINAGTVASGNVLTSDGSGNGTWQPPFTPASVTDAFKATNSAYQFVSSGAFITLNFPNTDYNDGSHFAANSFTAPAAGLYHFNIKLLWALTPVAVRYPILVSLWQTPTTELSRTQYFIEPSAGGSYNTTTELDVDLKLSAGAVLYVTAYQGSTLTQQIGPAFTFFSGRRIY